MPEKALEVLLGLIPESPCWVFIIAIFLLAVHYGPAYIKVISEAMSLKRHDDVALLEKEMRIRRKIKQARERNRK